MRFVIVLLILSWLNGQGQTSNPEVKYKRSSLYTLMIENEGRPFAGDIRESFETYPIPEKFNDHNLKQRFIPATDTSKDQSGVIKQFLNEKFIARELIAKWFNRNEEGVFNMQLITERGFYNASEMDVGLARANKRGTAMLADAGEELIANTFVLVSDFKYVSKEDIAGIAKEGLALAGNLAGRFGVNVSENVSTLSDSALTIGAKGYVVKITSYLYRLVWNDSAAAVFYNEYWIEGSKPDLSKKTTFEKSDAYSLEFIGSEVAWSDLQSSSYTRKTDEELIRIATRKAIDAVIARLQKNHEQFRTKTPLFSTDPLAAKIGLKEGIEGGDKFDVLEQNQDENGKTFYKKLGVITVDKSHIWDNRYNAAEENPNSGNIDKTHFKGGKGYYPGMLIIQK